MKKGKTTLLALMLCSYMLLTGASWQKDDPWLFTVSPGNIQGQTQRDGLLYVGYDKEEQGGQIDVFDMQGKLQKTIGPMAIGHVSEMDFASWNGRLYVSDGTADYKTRVYELDVSGATPKILRTINNDEWGYGGLIAIDDHNKRMLLSTTEDTPGKVTFAYCDMDGKVLYDFQLPWIHVPQGLELAGNSIYYYLNTKLEIICAHNGCRKKTYMIPYEGENEGLSLNDKGEVFIGNKVPNRIYNIGRLDEGECPCLTAKPGWNKWNGKWYYYDDNLHMKKGWFRDGNTWYLMDEYTGVMKSGWFEDKQDKNTERWYYLKQGGAMATGWQQLGWSGGSSWFYFRGSGKMATGWQKLGWNGKDSWYYFQGNGTMAKGMQQLDWNGKKETFLFTNGGAMRTGWVQQGNNWLYFKPSGAMAAAERLTINGAQHDFSSNGTWLGQI